jgi:hypothetical protein
MGDNRIMYSKKLEKAFSPENKMEKEVEILYNKLSP